MNYSKGGIAIAKKIAEIYQTHPNIEAILVGGSVARNTADDYSDLEIGVFWNQPPADETRIALIEAAGGDLWSIDSFTEYGMGIAGEHWGLNQIEIDGTIHTGSLMIDVKHMTVNSLQQCVRDVIVDWDTSLEKQVILSAIVDCVPLYGFDQIGKWQSQAQLFPVELAVKIIQENLWFGPWFPPKAYSQRKDQLVMRQHILWAMQALLQILAAVNQVYFPSKEFKWISYLANRFQIAPDNLNRRLMEIFDMDLDQSWDSMKKLIDETILLVEEYIPEVNSLSLFENHSHINTDWAKARWVPDPPYSLMKSAM